MVKILSFANFKGGVGKTSTTALTSWALAAKGYKVLALDFDAQANLTSLLLKTKASGSENAIITIDRSLMSAINENIPINEIAISITDNLDLVPTAVDFSMYPRYLDKMFNSEIEKVSFFKNALGSFKDKYDFIFIDVPPTLSLQNDTAFYACDDIVVVLQTQERSMAGAEAFIQYLQNTLINEFESSVDVLGILPVLSKRNAQVDAEILEAAKQEFGEENIFRNTITIMERIKRMDMTGITANNNDRWDNKVHESFSLVADELIARLNSVKEG